MIHNLHRHEVDDLKCSPKARMSMRTTSINIYVNMKDTDVKKKFNILDSKDKKEVDGFTSGDSKAVAWVIKKLLLNREVKNPNTLDALMREHLGTYDEFVEAFETEKKDKLMKKWQTQDIWRAFIEGCVTIRVQPTDVMGNKSTKDGLLCSFRVEFTAPQILNAIIKEIIEKKLCEGSLRVKEFGLVNAEERAKMVILHGMLSDVSVKVLDGINLETLRKFVREK